MRQKLTANPLIRGRRTAFWRSWRTALLMCAMLLLASACQPSPVIEPESTPVVLEVGITPALRIFAPQLQACALELPNTGLVLTDSDGLFEAKTAPTAPPLSLRWGAEPAPPGFAAIIGQEELAVVVHPDNPLTSISTADLRAIYLGTMVNWAEEGGEIDAWSYPAGSDTQRVFERAVMEGQAVSARAAGIAPDPAAMLEVVAGSPTAVGFLPRSWLNEQVKAITIQDADADRLAEQLRAPILAISRAEPRGGLRDWLLCLQESLPQPAE